MTGRGRFVTGLIWAGAWYGALTLGRPGSERTQGVAVLEPVLLPAGATLEVPGEIAVNRRGRIYVADGQTIVVLTPEGRQASRIGRRGRGPGEFLEITGLSALGGDSLFVWDGIQRRLTLLDGSTGLVLSTRTLSAPPGYGSPRQSGFAARGGVLRVAWKADLVLPDGTPDTVVVADHSGTEGGQPRILAALPGTGWKRYGPVLGPARAFGPAAIVGFGRDGTIAIGDGLEYCVRILPSDAAKFDQFCIPWQRAPIAYARSVISDSALLKALRTPQITAAIVAGQEYDRSRNSYDALLLDDLGRVWVRPVDSSQQHHPLYMARIPELRPPHYVWEVRDSTGRLVGRAAMSSRFRPRAIAGAHIYGIYEETDGSETVRVAPIPSGALRGAM